MQPAADQQQARLHRLSLLFDRSMQALEQVLPLVLAPAAATGENAEDDGEDAAAARARAAAQQRAVALRSLGGLHVGESERRLRWGNGVLGPALPPVLELASIGT